MKDKIFDLKLTGQDLDYVIVSLQELPAKIANPLTDKIQQMIQPQLEEFKKSKEEANEHGNS